MRYVGVACPRCDAHHEYLLSGETARHLRQCPDCRGWFVRDTAAEETTFLDDPPQCPVAGCEETLSAEALPVHVIERHDASLSG